MCLKADGRAAFGQRYRCRACGTPRTDRTGSTFARYHWPREVIVMAVRWYARFRLSLLPAVVELTPDSSLSDSTSVRSA
jgi:transposase-like protein